MNQLEDIALGNWLCGSTRLLDLLLPPAREASFVAVSRPCQASHASCTFGMDRKREEKGGSLPTGFAGVRQFTVMTSDDLPHND